MTASVTVFDYAVDCAVLTVKRAGPPAEPVDTPFTPEQAENWVRDAITRLARLPDAFVTMHITDGNMVHVAGTVSEQVMEHYHEYIHDPRERSVTLSPCFTNGERDRTYGFSMCFDNVDHSDVILEQILFLYTPF
jgi:hypothetical protein